MTSNNYVLKECFYHSLHTSDTKIFLISVTYLLVFLCNSVAVIVAYK